MIRGLFLMILCTSYFLSGEARETLPKNSSLPTMFGRIEPQGVYSSGWEKVPSWKLSAGKGTFLATYTRQLPQISSSILQKGVVVVYAKGYDFEGVSKAEEKPLGLPFYMSMASEATPQLYAWSFAVEEGKVKVALSMDLAMQSSFELANKEVMLRFFVLPEDFINQHKLSVMAVRKMTYQQLVSLLNTTP